MCELMHTQLFCYYPDSKVHEANMGPIWDQQDPGGPHFDPMNFAIWVVTSLAKLLYDSKLYKYNMIY